MADLALGAKAAAQQVRDRLTLLAILGLILAHDSGDVYRTILPCHTANLSYSQPKVNNYLGYNL